MKPNNKPSGVVSQIKLKSACLLATKADIDEALFSFEDVSSSLHPVVTNILQEFTDAFHKMCHREYHLFEGLSIRLT